MSRVKTIVSLLGAPAVALSLTACGGDSDEYCELIREGDSQFANADPEDPEAQAEVRDLFKQIIDVAPDDIRGDWETLSNTYDAMINIDASDEEAMAELEASSAEFEAASTRINENVQQECDLDLQM